MAKRCLTLCHTLTREFQRWAEDRCVEKYVPTRLPLEDRSERDAPVGVLIGRRKILLKKVSGDRVFQRQMWLSVRLCDNYNAIGL